MTQEKISRRVLMVGLDGFDPALAERLIAAGLMPNLEKLRRQCACVPLEHGEHRYTGLAWEHVATGQGPELSRHWSAVDFDPVHYEVHQPDTVGRPFMSGLPVRTVVFDAPYFDLQQAPHVLGVVNWGAHDPGTRLQSSPPGLMEEIRARFGEYAGAKFIYGFTWPSVERTRLAGATLSRAARQRNAVIQWLLQERIPEWELAYVVWSEFHSVIEPMWHGLDTAHPLHAHPSAAPAGKAVEEVYKAVDEGIGALATCFPDVALVLFSMHGMGPNHADVPSMALLPEFMYRLETGKVLLQSRAEWAQQSVPELGPDESWERAVSSCLQHPPMTVLDRLWHGVRRMARRRQRLRNLNWMPGTHYQRYWQNMTAFAFPSFYDGRIRVNLKGRESRGLVDPTDYESVCDRIEKELRACINPATGGPAVSEIKRISLAKACDLGPSESDIVVMWTPDVLALQHPRLGCIGPLPVRRTGGHTGGHGIAYIRDDRLTPGVYPVHASFDVVPTILDMLGFGGRVNVSGHSLLAEDDPGVGAQAQS